MRKGGRFAVVEVDLHDFDGIAVATVEEALGSLVVLSFYGHPDDNEPEFTICLPVADSRALRNALAEVEAATITQYR